MTKEIEDYYNPKFSYKQKSDFEQNVYILKDIDGNIIDTKTNVLFRDVATLEHHSYEFVGTTFNKIAFELHLKETVKYYELLKDRQKRIYT